MLGALLLFCIIHSIFWGEHEPWMPRMTKQDRWFVAGYWTLLILLCTGIVMGAREDTFERRVNRDISKCESVQSFTQEERQRCIDLAIEKRMIGGRW